MSSVAFTFGLLSKVICVLTLSSLAFGETKKSFWIYTSIYKEYITPIKEAFERANPDLDVRVFQSGSEKIQQKIEAELVGGKVQADIVVVSDPYWAAALSDRGMLEDLGEKMFFQNNYYSLMVMIANKQMAMDKRPRTFADLKKPEIKGLVQMGSPLESGSSFSAVAVLSEKYQWAYFKALRANDVSATGGNSTVIQKVESGEKKLGVVLLENALAAMKRGSPIEIIYPEDGGIIIPSVQFIFKKSEHKEEAKKFGRFLLSQEGQNFLRQGYMYSIRNDVKAPEGARPFAAILKTSNLPSDQSFKDIGKRGLDIKKKFSQLVLQ